MQDDKQILKSRLSAWKRQRYLTYLSIIPVLAFVYVSSTNSLLETFLKSQPMALLTQGLVICLLILSTCSIFIQIHQMKMTKHIDDVLTKPIIQDLGDLLEMRSDPLSGFRYFTHFRSMQSNDCFLTLLVEFNETEGHFLTANQIRNLSPLLKSENVPLVLATLGALERVGIAANLPQLRKLVAGDYPNSKDSAVKDVAQQCLKSVEQRVKEGLTQATLLRPAPVVTEGLLRPSINENSVEKTDGLLRVADKEEIPEANSETSVDTSKYLQHEGETIEVKPLK